MKYLRFFILFIVFIAIVMYVSSNGSDEYEGKNKVLDNNVSFAGNVTDVKQSNNHTFGIITLNLTKSNVKDFNGQLEDGIYPYRILGNTAELYTIIPDGIRIGNSVSLKSNEKNSHYYYVKTKQKSEGYVWVITEPTDIEFVKENSIFR